MGVSVPDASSAAQLMLGSLVMPRPATAAAEETEAFVTAQGIAITGRREFRGTRTIFIRDPDRNVLELVGPGPSVSELIREHVDEIAT